MALTIGEASAAADVLKAVTAHELAFEADPDPARIAAALRLLDAKAARTLQLSRIVPDERIDAAAERLAQHWTDALGGAW